MLYKHLHPSDLIQKNYKLALSVLNRQASIGYKELAVTLTCVQTNRHDN